MGVDCVVADGPEYSRYIEEQSGEGDAAVDGTPAHEGAEVEGQAEKRLWPPCESLHERVGGDQREGCYAQNDCCFVELQKDNQGY